MLCYIENMERLKYVSPEYQERLNKLASLLCERYKPVEQPEPEVTAYAEVADTLFDPATFNDGFTAEIE